MVGVGTPVCTYFSDHLNNVLDAQKLAPNTNTNQKSHKRMFPSHFTNDRYLQYTVTQRIHEFTRRKNAPHTENGIRPSTLWSGQRILNL